MKRSRLKKVVAVVAVALVVLAGAFLGGSLWWASNQLLFPSWNGAAGDLALCGAETAEHWGEGCGNLRVTREFAFTEVEVPSLNGYALPGWLIRAAANGGDAATGAIVLVHSGGGDRREVTRHVGFFLERGLDVLTLDLGCHGEAPCPVPGLTYGERESADVLSAYLYLADRYDVVYAMGSSVGAAAVLIALPAMPGLDAAIVENPMTSFERLMREAPQAQSSPVWLMDGLLGLTKLRGRFDGLLAPEHALPLAQATTPILFIHSRGDALVSYRHSQELAEAYRGPKSTWFPDQGGHSAIRDADPVEYERRVAEFLDGVSAVSATAAVERPRRSSKGGATAVE